MFKVTITKEEVVAAALPLQEHWLPLSNLDLLLPPINVGVFFCYKEPKNNVGFCNFVSMARVLRKALEQVLVTYYAFAGEFVPNSMGEPELLCNNRGVEFVEAYADVELDCLNFYNPDESVEGKLVPKKKHGVFAVQVTELKCGGLVVACSFDHRVADAYSANMFLVSWAETANAKVISESPCFRRSILNPKHPISVDNSLDDKYILLSKLPPPPTIEDHEKLESRIYYVKYDELIKLQSTASENGTKRTKLESFSAFLWQLVAKSGKNEIKLMNGNIKTAKLGIVVDGRTRLTDHNMKCYFGNVLSIAFGSQRIDQVAEKSLSSLAHEVHEFLETAVTKDHFLCLVDWVEMHRPELASSLIYLEGNNGTGPAIVVSSGQRFPVHEMDFGWGGPVFGSYHFPGAGLCGYVMPMPSPSRNGDWVVYMQMLPVQLEFIETEAAHFFRPLTYDYLNLVSDS